MLLKFTIDILYREKIWGFMAKTCVYITDNYEVKKKKGKNDDDEAD